MHIRIKNKTATIFFEEDPKHANHLRIIDELIHLVEHEFRTFVLDFNHLEIGFNSTVSGFILGMVKKLLESGCNVEINNISRTDSEILELIGIKEIEGKIKYSIKNDL